MKNKRNKKGFTLIELLAVIVILAILILLAMPAVLGLMEKAKKNSFVTESQSLVKIAQTAYTSESASGTVCYGLGWLKENGYTDKALDADNGFVKLVPSVNDITSTLYYTNDDYEFNGVASDDLAIGQITTGGLTTIDTACSGSGDVLCTTSCVTNP